MFNYLTTPDHLHCVTFALWPIQLKTEYENFEIFTHFQAYQFFGEMTMAPLILAHMLIIVASITIGKENIQLVDCIKNFTEKENSLVMRMSTFMVALFGFYPQYRALRTVLIGRGWVTGDWEREHKYNIRNLYVIEPLVESLLQVPTL